MVSVGIGVGVTFAQRPVSGGGGGGGDTIAITSSSYTVGSSGNPATLDYAYTYTGSSPITAYLVTGTNPVTVSEAQLIAGSGGTNTIEFTSWAVGASPDTEDLTGGDFTSASDAADRVVLMLSDGTVNSVPEPIVVSGLDYTIPAYSSSSPADGATGQGVSVPLVFTLSENVFEGTGNFYLYEDEVLVETVAVSSCTGFGTTDIAIPHADFSNGVFVSIGWDEGVVIDASGGRIAANTGHTLWNFGTVSAAVSFTLLDSGLASDTTTNETTKTLSAMDTSGQSGTDPVYIAVGAFSSTGTSGAEPVSATLDGNALTLITAEEVTSAFRPGSGLFELVGVSLGASSDLVVTTDENCQRLAAAVVSAPNAASSGAGLSVAISGSTDTITLDRDTGAGDGVFACAMLRDAVLSSETGFTAIATVDMGSGETFVVSTAGNVAAETPRAMNYVSNNNNPKTGSVVVLST